jgi:hypothetical protein
MTVVLQAIPPEEPMPLDHIEDEICELRDTTFPLGMHLISIVHCKPVAMDEPTNTNQSQTALSGNMQIRRRTGIDDKHGTAPKCMLWTCAEESSL